MEHNPTDRQKGKRPRRSEGSGTGEMTPAGVFNASKRQRIVSKVHTSMQTKGDRTRMSKEEREEIDWLTEQLSPRPKGYVGLGLGRPSQEPKRGKPALERIPTVSHLIRKLEQFIEIPDTDEEDEAEKDQVEGPSNIAGRINTEVADTDREQVDGNGLIGTDGEQGDSDGPVDGFGALDRDEDDNLSREVMVSEEEDDSDSSWNTDDEDAGTGSSDLYSAETESLGYVTSEEGSVIGEVVDQAIIEASLEGLNITDDRELGSMDRAKKRILLRNTDFADLRRLQRRKLIDETDVGTVLLDRLDQDLRRIGLNATSVLRLLELTGTLISGSFLLPVLARGILIPNDLDFFASLESYKAVLSYLKKKGYTQCEQIFPKKGRRPGYGTGLQDISIIFELRNKKTFKINVIVSISRPVLPILQFHSTPVMNYVAHHGFVCLYDSTIYHFGVANYIERLPLRIEVCFEKYRRRGIEITEKLDEEHICRLDACCPQTVRSLFDRDVIHVRFPDFMETSAAAHRKSEADIALWRLATAAACNGVTVDDVGFVLCDDKLTLLKR